VLKLARQLVNQSGLRQGSLSKAARGYHLAQGNAPRGSNRRDFEGSAKASVEQGWKPRWSWRFRSGSTMKNCGFAAIKGRKRMCWRRLAWCAIP
jgi:hypothetical protein